jgi:hypothetical protein
VETACNTNSGGSSTDPAVNHPNQRELGSTGVDDRRVPDNAVPGSKPNIEQIEK